MSIEHVLAVVPVADLAAAYGWYERLLGRPADNRPMESLAEWRVTETGWIQVFHDAERAGGTLVNFAVNDLERHVAVHSSWCLSPGPIETGNKNVRRSAITDPDGNRITFIGNFLIRY
jgi:catechol 2,3-dioxygenase-like lactoylglutathione lyase family enzyme